MKGQDNWLMEAEMARSIVQELATEGVIAVLGSPFLEIMLARSKEIREVPERCWVSMRISISRKKK